MRSNRAGRDVGAQRERTTEVVALTEAQGFPFWLGLGRALHAAARVEAGDAGALLDILPALAIVGATAAQAALPAMLKIPAEAQRAAGQLAEAEGTSRRLWRSPHGRGSPYFDADLHRLDGDILRATGRSGRRGGGSLPTRPRRRPRAGRRSFELRAATSLARLWRDQGEGGAARDILAPVYATFTEGFETRDLQDAKTLLDALA